ncbi:perlucin-like [Ylistrum balloti]|uniref:perlucin-like n=1 Tax=Ylistrum balloti TaxID=509963 RepID=UPI002905E7D7|nr:perlucin-like [Ylistrum balloti]
MARNSEIIVPLKRVLSSATGCRNGWVRFENSCYFFSKDAETWAEASIMCTDLHSHLAILESTAENTFLKAEAHRFNAVGYWIDGTDLEVENVWRWTSNGDKLAFTDWGGNDPNAGTSANCLVLWRDFSYQWADEGCRRIYNFLCEMSLRQWRGRPSDRMMENSFVTKRSGNES